MSKIFVLMAAMPPTIGHLQLIQFASLLTDKIVDVIVYTQPDEPFINERVSAIKSAVIRLGLNNVAIQHFSETAERRSKTPDYNKIWQDLVLNFNATSDDCIVASEKYGLQLAEVSGMQFFPYDIDRNLNSSKATFVRNDPINNFDQIIPEFQSYLQTTVTILGDGSDERIFLSSHLAKEIGGQWLFEYAQTFLENTANQITSKSLTAIWKGQAALQKHAKNLSGKPLIIQNTDLFSVVNTWQQQLDNCPQELINDAIKLKSDLYIIIGNDNNWMKLCNHYKLTNIIIKSNDPGDRLEQAKKAVSNISAEKVKSIAYVRKKS